LVGNLTKKLQILFHKTCRSFTPRSSLPFLCACRPARERSVIPSLLLSSTRTCNRRRLGRVLWREGELFGVALFSASPLSCGGRRSRPALRQRSVPVPNAKEPDPKNGDGFSKVEPELESFFCSKWGKFLKNKKGGIFCHNFSEYLPNFENNTNNFELWF
jgi:hypothetical protein